MLEMLIFSASAICCEEVAVVWWAAQPAVAAIKTNNKKGGKNLRENIVRRDAEDILRMQTQRT